MCAALALPAQLPAGVSYTDCINYPFCDVNRAIVAQPYAVPVATAIPAPVAKAPAAPANVNPARCPGYPFCDTNAAHHPSGPALGFPAGVDPTSCPGYPFHQCKTY